MTSPMAPLFSAPKTEDDRIASTPIAITAPARRVERPGHPKRGHPPIVLGAYSDSDWDLIVSDLERKRAKVDFTRDVRDRAERSYRAALADWQNTLARRDMMIRGDPRTATQLDGLAGVSRSRISQLRNDGSKRHEN